jgi:hypothetical protein
MKNEEGRMENEEWRGKNGEGRMEGEVWQVSLPCLIIFWDERKSRDTHEDVTARY